MFPKLKMQILPYPTPQNAPWRAPSKKNLLKMVPIDLVLLKLKPFKILKPYREPCTVPYCTSWVGPLLGMNIKRSVDSSSFIVRLSIVYDRVQERATNGLSIFRKKFRQQEFVIPHFALGIQSPLSASTV